jgi:hypothetical protein
VYEILITSWNPNQNKIESLILVNWILKDKNKIKKYN